MKQIIAVFVIATTLAGSGPVTTAVNAREPSYLILRAPARSHKGNSFYPGRGYQVRTHAYAYGWFGVRPRCHLERSMGYNSSYIQWSKQ